MKPGKVYPTALRAVEDVFDGAVVMLGGFGGPGLPQSLVKALIEQGARDLTFICNTCFEPKPDEHDVARLVDHGRVRKLITTFMGRPNQEIPHQELEAVRHPEWVECHPEWEVWVACQTWAA